ncbi:GNAT family N-acetyltransferase [Streptomyces phaeochromogenes]|uniref:GNAT family N-acetyltransferase n=1 Tax=Streptomyces phaeochromogenes TaxID=1923 RepID=A0ABZ1HCA8_STRPH|nr:N-acetyltransferase [Streptomyces phaeochromogenes]WRZ30625.1 GNAT family N-acetyltransferase [Streptomyces phaeochromogenes]WSD16231.1 GNAT family N-acetyltransferase [Streptomyces phaeochromogenes]WSS94784.1 GNAT family N-acetyltransferase [Streptomyces phaeochromogenes]
MSPDVRSDDRLDASADHVVRSVRADEWPAAKELRLAALRDPVAHLAFLETYEAAVGRPDSFWRERAAGAAEGVRERQQVVAVAPDGRWVGSVVVLVEEAGAQGALGDVSEVRQGHFVAVYVRPEVRGRGLTERLFAYALEWAWEVAGVERVRLFVDERNGRAEAFYRKFGFVPTGESVPVPGDPGARELEFVFKRS